MGRFPQPEGTKGSLKWVQLLINDCPELINTPLQRECSLTADDPITWVSPLRNDEFAEYRDLEFLHKLGVSLLKRPLNTFWPNRGPQWDTLGRTDKGTVFLVEAKAHINEILSPGTGASGRSKAIIEKSFQEVRSFLRIRSSTDWSKTLYQYANRLAHLYLLRELNSIPAYLVFVYFMGDKEVEGPSTEGEWKSAIQLARGILGLHEKDRLRSYIIDVFVDVGRIKAAIKDNK